MLKRICVVVGVLALSLVANAVGPYSFDLQDWSNGLNQKAQSALLKDGNATSLNNVDFDIYGAVRKRNGYETVISTVKTIDIPIDFNYSYEADTTPAYQPAQLSTMNMGMPQGGDIFGTSTYNRTVLHFTVPTVNNIINGILHIKFKNTQTASSPNLLQAFTVLACNPANTSNVVPPNYNATSLNFIAKSLLLPSGNETVDILVSTNVMLTLNANAVFGVILDPAFGRYSPSFDYYAEAITTTWNTQIDTPNSYLRMTYFANNPNSINATQFTTPNATGYYWFNGSPVSNNPEELVWGDYGLFSYRTNLKFDNTIAVNKIKSVRLYTYKSRPALPPGLTGLSYLYKNTNDFSSTTFATYDTVNAVMLDTSTYQTDPIGTEYSVDLPVSWLNDNYGWTIRAVDNGCFMYSPNGLVPPVLEVTYYPTINNTVKKIYSFVKNDGTEYLFGTNDTTIFKATTDNNFVSFYAGITSYNMFATAYDNQFYFTNNKDGLIVTDGDSIRKVAIVPTFGWTIATGTIGLSSQLDTGNYSYKYSVVDNLGESYTVSTARTIYVKNGEAVLVSVNVNGTILTFNSLYIYRSLVNSGVTTDYYFTIMTTSGKVTDDTNDIRINHFAPINQPPLAKYIYVLKNRLWLANNPTFNNNVYCSTPLDPSGLYNSALYWDNDYPYAVDGQSNTFALPGQGITGLSDLFDSILVFMPYQVYAGIGDDPSSATGFFFKKTSSQTGTKSPMSIAKSEQEVYFLAPDGRLASFSGQGNRGNDSYTFDLLKSDYIGDLAIVDAGLVNKNALDMASGWFALNKYYCSVPRETTYNNLVFVYENKLPAISKYTIPAGNFTEYDNKQLYFCSSTDGFSYKFNNSYSDAGNAIPGEFHTKWLVLQDTYQNKRLDELFFRVRAENGTNINWEIYTDFSLTPAISGSFLTSGIGEVVKYYGATTLNKLPPFKRLKFRVYNNSLNQSFVLYSIKGNYDYYRSGN